MRPAPVPRSRIIRSEEHTSELQSHDNLVCRLLLEKNKILLEIYRQGRKRAVVGDPVEHFADIGDPDRPLKSISKLLKPLLFFFNNPPTTEIYPFPPPAPFPI